MTRGRAKAGEAARGEDRPAAVHSEIKPRRAFPRLVLASRSPRRRLLLDEHGFGHEVCDTGVDDGVLEPGDATARQWVAALAYLKARAGAAAVKKLGVGDALVLGADTVCVKGGRLIGQARDAGEARRMIEDLENGEHEVVTGVALVPADGGAWRDVRVDWARVSVGDIGRDRIEAYVQSGEWRGKAGSYNLSERIEAGWPIQFQGDPTTIMGLPMRMLAPILKDRVGTEVPVAAETSA